MDRPIIAFVYITAIITIGVLLLAFEFFVSRFRYLLMAADALLLVFIGLVCGFAAGVYQGYPHNEPMSLYRIGAVAAASGCVALLAAPFNTGKVGVLTMRAQPSHGCAAAIVCQA